VLNNKDLMACFVDTPRTDLFDIAAAVIGMWLINFPSQSQHALTTILSHETMLLASKAESVALSCIQLIDRLSV
jgi:hypothetical protein